MKVTQCVKCEGTIDVNGDWSTYQEGPICYECWEEDCGRLWWEMLNGELRNQSKRQSVAEAIVWAAVVAFVGAVALAWVLI